jgi:hypothetical protein
MNSPCSTGRRAIANGSSRTGCDHFSLSNTKSGRAARRAQLEFGAAELHVAAAGIDRRSLDLRRRIAERLPRMRERLGVHVLVRQRQPEKIKLAFDSPAFERERASRQHVVDVGERRRARRQRQAPALRMRDRARVVPAVCLRQHRRRAPHSRRHQRSMNQPTWPTSHKIGLIVASCGTIHCASDRSSTSDFVYCRDCSSASASALFPSDLMPRSRPPQAGCLHYHAIPGPRCKRQRAYRCALGAHAAADAFRARAAALGRPRLRRDDRTARGPLGAVDRGVRQEHPGRALIVVLTGTDLYGGLDATARRSLAVATRIVVLNELGADAVPARWRAKTEVILPSATPLANSRHASARSMSPSSAICARSRIRGCRCGCAPPARHLPPPPAARRPRARARAGRVPRARPRARQTLPLAGRHRTARCARADPPRAAAAASVENEGGATVIVEALQSGTPVIASDCAGNVGLLGANYPGLFPVGDMQAAQALLLRAEDEPRSIDARTACRRRARLFTPAREARSLRADSSIICSATPRRSGT